MTTRSAITGANETSKPASSRGAASGKANRKSSGKPRSAKLPEWNVADLYSGIDAPEITRDLTRLDAECATFETDYKGKLAEHTAKEDGGKWLAEAVRRYEAIEDLAGRLGSYAGLVHAGDSVDPAISKFYRDVSERPTNSSVHLLVFPLEFNPVADAVVGSVRAAYPRLSHRYYVLKAGWFKKKKLAHWDRNAPLPFAATGRISWPDAQNMVLTAYRGFSPEMASIAERFFTDRWIDAPVRPGKAPGAFALPP